MYTYRLLHRRLQSRVGADLVEPLGVDRAGRPSERERQARARVIRVQDVNLRGQL